MSLEKKAIRLVKEAILRGEFGDGLLPSEYQLAERFGVSRTPIRAALRHLELEGLVRNKTRRGYEVVTLGPRVVREMFEVREALECYAVLAEDARLNVHRLRMLRRIFRFYEQASLPEMDNFDIDCLREADAQLHQEIGRSLENDFASEILDRAEMQLAGVQLMAWAARERTTESVREHIEIIDALLEEKYGHAAELLRKHISYGRTTMLAQLGQRAPMTNYLFAAKKFIEELLNDDNTSDEIIAQRVVEERIRRGILAETG